ncbi:unnamed protein product, partial [Musa acuminata var. zebrina]
HTGGFDVQSKQRRKKHERRVSSERGGEGAEGHLVAGDGEAHVVLEAELLLGLAEEALELGVVQVGDGHDVPAPVLADVHHEVAPGHVHRRPFLLLLPPQARAPLQYLLQHRCLSQLVLLLHCHSFAPFLSVSRDDQKKKKKKKKKKERKCD